MTRQLKVVPLGTLATMGLIVLVVTLSAIAQGPKPGETAGVSGPKPKETTGISLKASTILPLGAQIPALKGYAMEIRTIVLKPGAVAAYHNHANRPVVAYLVSGDYTEHRDGQGMIVHKPGEQWVEDASVAHWSETRGTETTHLINVEVFKE